MNDVGCTTPFGPNKTNICRFEELGHRASKKFHGVYSKYLTYHCFDPCHTILPSIAITDRSNNSYRSARIKIPLKVKQMTSRFSYDFLSLIAEVGGYVGLFLGVSVTDINSFVEALVLKIILVCKRKVLKKNVVKVNKVMAKAKDIKRKIGA